MGEKSSSSSSGGIGFAGLLTVAFIVLKLTGVIDWSWWWVWSPILIGIGLALLVLVVVFSIAGILSFLDYRDKKKNPHLRD